MLGKKPSSWNADVVYERGPIWNIILLGLKGKEHTIHDNYWYVGKRGSSRIKINATIDIDSAPNCDRCLVFVICGNETDAYLHQPNL